MLKGMKKILEEAKIWTLTRWVPYDGYIRHQNDHLSGRMTDITVMGEWQVVGVEDSATPECFGRGSQGTIFVRSSKLSLFFPELCSFRRVFCFPRFCKIWRQTFERWGWWFRRCLGALFGNSARSPGILLRTPTTTSSIFWKFPFFFSNHSRCYLPDSYGDPQVEQSILVMICQKLEWKLHFRALGRSSEEEPAIVVVIGTSHLRWSMVQKRKKNTRKSACDCAKSQPFIIDKPASFDESVSKTKYRYRFSLRCFHVRGCTAAGRSGCSAGTAKKSGHPRHFWCWSPTRNELECINLVYWREVLYGFSSRDAIIVVGSVLEKHFEGEFTPDQGR